MVKKTAKEPEPEVEPLTVGGVVIKERFFHTRVVYETMLYSVNKELIRYEFPDPEVKENNNLIGIQYQKDINLLGSINFMFNVGTTDLETFGQAQTTASLQTLPNLTGGKDKVYAKIKYFKTYVEPRTYGERLCGLRCYDKDDLVVLEGGWYDPNYLICKRWTLNDNEQIWGFESYIHKSTPGVHYDVVFRIRDAI
jgi:hypothetical protein